MKTGDRVTVDITGLNSEGYGIARCGAEGFVLFIPDSLPGERVTVRLTQVKRHYAAAVLMERHTCSSERTEPRCPVYARCGGCQLQHMTYSAQVQFKSSLVEDALKRIAGITLSDPVTCIPSPRQWGYRNKASFPIHSIGKDRFSWGYYASRSHRIVPIPECPVLEPELLELAGAAADKLRETRFEGYDERRSSGNMRYLVVRKGSHTGDLLLGLVAGRFQQKRETGALKALHSFLRPSFPRLRGIVLNVNPERGNFIWGPVFRLLSGKNEIREQLNGFSFLGDISSFFQVNTLQAEQLFSYASSLAGEGHPERILELYSGGGSLTAYLASSGKCVEAVEEWAPAVELLRQNMKLNALEHVRVHGCSAEEAMEHLEAGCGTVVMDPPRSGCDRRVLEGLQRFSPKKIIYVSCNPATLARDAAVLKEQGFLVESVRAFDLFPQTAHVETVACLVKK